VRQGGGPRGQIYYPFISFRVSTKLQAGAPRALAHPATHHLHAQAPCKRRRQHAWLVQGAGQVYAWAAKRMPAIIALNCSCHLAVCSIVCCVGQHIP
jgi:hypothetical protein